MDIHPPHEAIMTKKQFFIHLSMVTLGILIALGLEGLLNWREHRALVREARENILTEVRANQQSVDRNLAELKKREDELNHIVALSRQLERDPGSFKHGSMTFQWVSVDLPSAAWKTASVSGAVTYMKYDELNRYTQAYDSQQVFEDLSNQGIQSLAELGPLIQAAMEEKKPKDVPKEKFVQIQQAGYRQLLIVQFLENVSKEMDKDYDKILNQK